MQPSRERGEGILPDRLAHLHAQLRACRRCPEAGYTTVPGAVFSGSQDAQVMVVGQAPGESETRVGRPFNGPSGRRLFRWLADAGWGENWFRATQYITAITKCYPGKGRGGKGDRAPTRREQRLCAPFLERELELVRPALLIPVGGMAVRRFCGPGSLSSFVGQAYEIDGRWVVPLPHPSGASLWLNQPANQALLSSALGRLAEMGSSLGIDAE
jgi:uracil-DNA glycosylase